VRAKIGGRIIWHSLLSVLGKDGFDAVNLAGKNPDLVARAEALMKAAHSEDPNWPYRDRTTGRPQQQKQKR